MDWKQLTEITGGAPFVVERVRLRASGIAIEGSFQLPLLAQLLAALLPQVAYGPVNRALKENGMDVDISKLRPEDFEGLVVHLQELQVDVDDGNDKVRVFCE